MRKIFYGFYWDDEATELIEEYSERLPMVRNLWFESERYIPYKENEVLNIQVERVTGHTVEAAVKKIRKFVTLHQGSAKAGEAQLSVNIMLCFIDPEKVEIFLEENTKLVVVGQKQKDLFL